MPCIGHHSGGIEPSPCPHRILIKSLLEKDGNQRRQQCDKTRRGERLALKEADSLLDSIPGKAYSYESEQQAHDHRSKRLILAMPIVVVCIHRFARNMHKNHNNYVSDEIRQRMDSICNHRGAVTHDSRHKLEHHQKEIDHPSYQRHFINLFFPFLSHK